jgi:hypothetical protein
MRDVLVETGLAPSPDAASRVSTALRLTQAASLSTNIPITCCCDPSRLLEMLPFYRIEGLLPAVEAAS